MGSAELSCACLEALFRNCPKELAGIVCQPDRPKGRNLKLTGCPVREKVRGCGVPVFTPENVNAPESLESIRQLAPDVIVVVAYGQFLGRELLALPPLGCINIHASLLPAYRGAAPIQWAIARGETVSGVTAMYMTSRMDAGDMILQRPIAIGPGDTGGVLHDAMLREGAQALLESLALVRRGAAPRVPQDEGKATFAPKLGREDGRIDWTRPAADIYNRVRAFNPWPGSFCEVETGALPSPALKVWKCRVEDAGSGAPGTLLSATGDGPLVAAGSGAVRLLEVQPEGRRVMSGDAYLRGHALPAGARMAVRRDIGRAGVSQ